MFFAYWSDGTSQVVSVSSKFKTRCEKFRVCPCPDYMKKSIVNQYEFPFQVSCCSPSLKNCEGRTPHGKMTSNLPPKCRSFPMMRKNAKSRRKGRKGKLEVRLK